MASTAVTDSNTPTGCGKITHWVKPGDKSGEFVRQVSSFRNWISNEPGARFPVEKGRYHLFVSYACPWAHRTLIARKLKGLEEFVSFSVVHWHLGEKGWRFPTKSDTDVTGDGVVPGSPLPDQSTFTHLREVYFSVDPSFAGRFTVPVLWDKVGQTIVSNESSEILRMFSGSLFGCAPELDLYPEDLRAGIDEVGAWTYDAINNGVYKSGFATTQEAYERNVGLLFQGLDRVEAHLREGRKNRKAEGGGGEGGGGGGFYWGDRMTETDIRLYVTLVRFDPAYVQHFKCNIRDIRSGYPAIHAWLRALYWQHDAFRSTTNFVHIKNHYTRSHVQINPHGITPVGPLPDILGLDQEVASAGVGRG